MAPDYVAVPREPTEEMVEAGAIGICDNARGCGGEFRKDDSVWSTWQRDARHAYIAMLAAAPQSPPAPAPERERIDGLIDIWSMRPQPGTPTGEAWEAGARQGWEWAQRELQQARSALEKLDAVLDFSEPETIKTFELPEDLSALKEAFAYAYDALWQEPKP